MNIAVQGLPVSASPEIERLFNLLQSQLVPKETEWAPHAACNFLEALPEVTDDLWLNRVLDIAGRHNGLNLEKLKQLSVPGPKSAAQMYVTFAVQLALADAKPFAAVLCAAARAGELDKNELAMLPVRALLADAGLLTQAQLAYVARRFPTPEREQLPDGTGIWLGCHAGVEGLRFALRSVLAHSQQHIERIGLALLAGRNEPAPALLETAKQFKNALIIRYNNEDELVEALRAQKMRVFIELHGLQNPASIIESMRTGVANIQLTWAGLPEACPVSFLDGQLLDPVLSQYKEPSCRAIPLHCWLPPIQNVLPMRRGESFGIWALNGKLSARFLQFCSELGFRAGRRVQLWNGGAKVSPGALAPNIDLVTRFADFEPAVLLDTSPLSGPNACLLALLNGIPVVTLPSDTLSSRLGASVLLHYGFAEGVADNWDEYAQLAIAMCKRKTMPHFSHEFDWELIPTVDRFFPR
jgi:hypothetical protein